MAFELYLGSQVATANDSDWIVHPNEVPGKCVRTIIWTGSDAATTVAQRVRDMQAAGKFVIVCIQIGTNDWNHLTVADWTTAVANYARLIPADAFELGNEPTATGQAAVTGPFWPRLKAAAEAVQANAPGVPRVLGAPYSDTGIQPYYDNGRVYFANLGLDIRDFIEGFAIHLYSSAQSANLTKLQGARTHVDAYANSWSNLPVYITEFGWTAYAPPGKPTTMVQPIGTGSDTTPGTMAGSLYKALDDWRVNRTTLKIRAATWYVWQDSSALKIYPTGYYGMKKNVFPESVSSPAAGVQPSPTSKSANGYRPVKTAFDNFVTAFGGSFDVPAATPPTAITDPADGLLTTKATLHGRSDPNGTLTNAFFDYGPTVAYGTTVAMGSIGSGSAEVSVTKQITGLVAGTLYHFRFRVVNSQAPSGVNGVDRTFSTPLPPVKPTVTLNGAVAVGSTTATLTGSVNPNNAASTAQFQYGTTSGSYTTTVPVPAISIPIGGVVNISAALTGLTPGTTYYWRITSTNSQGTTLSIESSFTPKALVVEDTLARVSVLSTELSVEVTTADGRIYRWDAENVDATRRPLGVAFSTQEGDGFADASCQLPRRIDLDWPDLHLLDSIRFIGIDGTVAYEGRIAALPRVVDTEGERIEIQANGLMSSAKDRTFTEIYVDRSGDRWQPASLAQRKGLMDADVVLDADYTATVDSGSIHLKGTTNKRINAGSTTMLEYIAPTGVALASFQYLGSHRNDTNETAQALYSSDDDSIGMGSWTTTALTLDSTLQGATPITPTAFFGLRLRCATVHGDGTAGSAAPALPAQVRYAKIAVYGDHGVATQDNGGDPDGVYASDVMADLVDRFCPLLNTDGIEPTSTTIAHLVFDTPTSPFDAMTLLNGFHLYSLGAWEGGKVVFAPPDLTTADWQVRREDLGVTLDLQGDAIDSFGNELVVTYTDIDSRQQVLWPDDFPEDLRDDDVDNPANKWGISLQPTVLDISNPVDQKGALAIGRVALAELLRPKSPGSVSINLGYIEDAQGNLQPGWKVRTGETLQITDLPNDQPRLITATSWTEEGALQITLEQPSTRVDAVLARLDLSSQVAGL